jgi:hypothetical protein
MMMMMTNTYYLLSLSLQTDPRPLGPILLLLLLLLRLLLQRECCSSLIPI